jgi:hypothetical protein
VSLSVPRAASPHAVGPLPTPLVLTTALYQLFQQLQLPFHSKSSSRSAVPLPHHYNHYTMTWRAAPPRWPGRATRISLHITCARASDTSARQALMQRGADAANLYESCSVARSVAMGTRAQSAVQCQPTTPHRIPRGVAALQPLIHNFGDLSVVYRTSSKPAASPTHSRTMSRPLRTAAPHIIADMRVEVSSGAPRSARLPWNVRRLNARA